MDELQRAVRKLRTPNFQTIPKFVPQESLYKLITEDAVKRVLGSSIAKQHLQETVEAIVPGTRKIFAILVLSGTPDLITRFIEDDQLQQTNLDHRLPYSLDQLRKILPQDDAVDCFYERQWEFTAPIFSGKLISRYLDDQTILPFIHCKKIGHGGFGIVYELTLHQDYCKFEHFAPNGVRTVFWLSLRTLVC